jgi:cytochrome c peroxidase
MKHFLMAACALALAACSSSAPSKSVANGPRPATKPIGKVVPLATPLGLPPVPVLPENLPTAETIALGEKLFFSPLLSSDKTLSCASCHDPKAGFADPRANSVGVGGKTGNRNAPTAQFAAYATTQFWDGRAATLEEQALGPIGNPIEMAMNMEDVEKRLQDDPQIRNLFQKAFAEAPSREGMARALATYERTLVRGNSPFDRYQYGGDKKALNESAKRGLEIFRDEKRGNCAVCHTIEKDFALFTDNKFHNLGVGLNAEGELTDLGRYAISKKDEDRGAFRTPTLRNIALTAPYMHDGSLRTLKEVVDFYVGGGNGNPHLDKEIKPLSKLTRQERADLEAFLESLTCEAIK